MKLASLRQINLLIDGTKINNKHGSENVGMNWATHNFFKNCEYRKKNITNLVFITDENKLPLSYYCNKIKEIKPYGRTTLEHESKLV